MIDRFWIAAAVGAGCLLSASAALAAEDHLNATAQEYRDPFYYTQSSHANETPTYGRGCDAWGNGYGRKCGHHRGYRY